MAPYLQIPDQVTISSRQFRNTYLVPNPFAVQRTHDIDLVWESPTELYEAVVMCLDESSLSNHRTACTHPSRVRCLSNNDIDNPIDRRFRLGASVEHDEVKELDFGAQWIISIVHSNDESRSIAQAEWYPKQEGDTSGLSDKMQMERMKKTRIWIRQDSGVSCFSMRAEATREIIFAPRESTYRVQIRRNPLSLWYASLFEIFLLCYYYSEGRSAVFIY